MAPGLKPSFCRATGFHVLKAVASTAASLREAWMQCGGGHDPLPQRLARTSVAGRRWLESWLGGYSRYAFLKECVIDEASQQTANDRSGPEQP